MARNENFFQRLTRLFRSGPSIQRRIKGYDTRSYYDSKLVQGNYGYRAPAPFGFGRENSPFSVLGSYGILDRMSRYAEFAEMEYSLHPNTKIATDSGYVTIKELSDRCEADPNYTFVVYSYDHNREKIVAALGKQARKTCHEEAWKVTFDNGTEIIGSFNHRLMKRDGTYCIIQDLKPGDAMMPFYRRSVASDRTEGQNNCYQTIYTIDRKENSYGWTAEHKLLAEFVLGRKLNKNEVVHHKNFKAHDNRIENLEVMNVVDHRKLHAEILNGKKWDYETNAEWIESFKKQHSAWMKKNNPSERKDIRFWGIVEVCEREGFNLRKVCNAFDTDPNTIKRKLKTHGFDNFKVFAKAYCPNYNPNKSRKKASKFDMQKVFSVYEKTDSLQTLAKKLNSSSSTLLRSLQRKGYENFSSFKANYNNLKVVSIESVGKMDLYDLTVDGYKNFATDSVISHNTPELAAAMDIYADETVGGDDRGRSFHIYSDDVQIKRALEELFYDVLNVEFNLRAWARNLPVKWNTPIPLLSGETITIKELSKRIKAGKEEWVYSVQNTTKNIVPGKVVWCDKSYTTNKIAKIKLDDGTVIETSPEHTFVLRNGQECRADELKVNDSLMPFYTRISNKKFKDKLDGYEKVYNPSTNHYKYTHRIVGNNKDCVKEYSSKETNGYVVTHHVDFNKRNNTPSNLVRMNSRDHIKLHSKHAYELLHQRPDVVEKRMKGINKWLKSDKHRLLAKKQLKELQALGKMKTSWADYNNSTLHKKHNIIRTKNKIKFWQNKEKANIARANMRLKFDDHCIEHIKQVLMRENIFLGRKKLLSILRQDKQFLKLFTKANQHSNRNILKSLNGTTFNELLKRKTKQDYCQFYVNLLPEISSQREYKIASKGRDTKLQKSIINHKVASVEIIEEDTDVYCMNVLGPNGEHDRHNFAICSQDKEGNHTRNGVFVSNCKYGDFFLYNEVLPEIGVINAQPIPVSEVEREEGFDEEDPYAVRFKWLTRGNVYLENWQVTHMRILGNDLFLPYGTAVLEPARRIWRQLIMMEDAMLVYRVVRCLHGDTRIWTTNGSKAIKDVKIGDMVYSFDKKTNKLVASNVTDFVCNGKQKIWQIKSKHRSIKTNDNHPLLVKNIETNKISYVKTKDLVPELHCIVQPSFATIPEEKIEIKLNKEIEKWGFLSAEGVKYFKNSDYNISKIKLTNILAEELGIPFNRIHQFLYQKPNKIKGLPYNKCKAICEKLTIPLSALIIYPKGMQSVIKTNIPQYVDEKFARFFGFMLGDGYITKSLYKIGFATSPNKKQNQFYSEILKEYSGSSVFHHDKRNSNKQLGKVYSQNYYLANLLVSMGYKFGAKNKRIPNWVFKASPLIKEAFLEGLIDADGHTRVQRKTKSYEIELCNKELVADVKELVHQLGWNVSSKIYSRTRPARKVAGKQMKCVNTTSHSLYFTKTLSELYEPILSVEPTEEYSKVYDIRVDNDLHNFIADGIVVHNSPERRVFYIDVANVAPNDVPSYMEAARATLRSHNVIEQSSGRMDMRYNPLAVDEDYYIPVRGQQSGTKIETLAGGQHVTATEDVQYIQSKLFAALKVPKPYLNYDENLSCLLSDTSIPLLCGETKTIEELAKEYKDNPDDFNRWAYSTTLKGKVVPGKIKKAWKTKEVKQYYRITLDNNEVVECTENHPFLLRNGIYKRADELEVGLSLMPIYRKISSKEKGNKLEGYEMVRDNQDQKWFYTHKMANSWKAKHNGGHIIGKARVVHHNDFDKLNNNPNNLVEMTWYDHRKLHSDPKHLDKTILRPDVIRRREKNRLKWLKSDEHKKISSAQMKFETTTPGRPLYDWIHGEKISSAMSSVMKENWKNPGYRHIKSKQNKEILQRPEVRAKIFGENHWARKKTRKYNLKWLIDFCKKSNVYEYKFFKESGKTGAPVSSRVVQRIFKENNISGWRHFTKDYLTNNHKIIKIELITVEIPVSVYDLEIENPENTHNFLIEPGIIVHNSKATLAQEDIRFSRTIGGIQKIIIAEMNKLAMIHLFAKGFDGENLINFELKLSNPSSVAIQQKLELLASKADVAGTLKETKLVDERWIQKYVLELTDDDISGIENGLYQDKIREAQLDAVAFETEAEQQTTTDTFSPANYEMGGDGVSKAPPPDDNESQSKRSGITGPEFNKNNPYKVNYQKGQTPIKATPFLTRNRKNSSRRVGQGGRANTASPDFAGMLNPSTNRSLRDVFDSDFLKSPTRREVYDANGNVIYEDNIRIRLEPILPNDMKSILRRLKDHFEQTTLKRNMLTEDVDLDDMERDPDDVILDFVTEHDNSSLDDDPQPTTLKEVMEEFDNDIEIVVTDDKEIELE